MSLYRTHLQLREHRDRMLGAILLFPTALIFHAGAVVLVICAIVSFVAYRLYPKASKALADFEREIDGSGEIKTQYQRDAEIGRGEDLVQGLRDQQTGALMLAAVAVKHGQPALAAYMVAKAAEDHSRLRDGC